MQKERGAELNIEGYFEKGSTGGSSSKSQGRGVRNFQRGEEERLSAISLEDHSIKNETPREGP